VVINIGTEGATHGLMLERIVAVLDVRGSGMKRARRTYWKAGKVIDLRGGAKAKCLILTDIDIMFLSPHRPEILISKLNKLPLSLLAGKKIIKSIAIPEHKEEENV
jgi:regulator of extracellular matrix RemA (YlzA/DUF370 family)